MSTQDLVINKKSIFKEITDVLLVILGCVVMAFGDALFIAPCGIISGGISSVGIIVNYWIEAATGFKSTDIVVAVAQVSMWVIGLIVVGKKFSAHTLIAMVVYPLMFSIIYRFDLGQLVGMGDIYAKAISGGADGIGSLLLCSVAGGILCGAGVALAYKGNGSTGGFNIISFIVARYSEIKEGTSSFIIDSALIILGAFVRWNEPNNFVLTVIGILCAVCCAIAIQVMYVNSTSFVICDIVSEKYNEINEYIINEMEHTATIFDAIGAFTGETRKLTRVVINEVETTELQQFIASIDPKAFVSFTKAKTINGEGFEPFYIRRKKKKLHRLQKEQEIDENGAR